MQRAEIGELKAEIAAQQQKAAAVDVKVKELQASATSNGTKIVELQVMLGEQQQEAAVVDGKVEELEADVVSKRTKIVELEAMLMEQEQVHEILLSLRENAPANTLEPVTEAQTAPRNPSRMICMSWAKRGVCNVFLDRGLSCAFDHPPTRVAASAVPATELVTSAPHSPTTAELAGSMLCGKGASSVQQQQPGTNQ